MAKPDRFSEGLKTTIDWYKAHQDWVTESRTPPNLSYYDRQYTRRDRDSGKL